MHEGPHGVVGLVHFSFIWTVGYSFITFVDSYYFSRNLGCSILRLSVYVDCLIQQVTFKMHVGIHTKHAVPLKSTHNNAIIFHCSGVCTWQWWSSTAQVSTIETLYIYSHINYLWLPNLGPGLSMCGGGGESLVHTVHARAQFP